MSANSDNGCKAIHPAGIDLHQDDIEDINNVYNSTHVGGREKNCIALSNEDATLEITSSNLHIIHSKVLY